jgi:uncharacterized membrane protein YfcA
MPIRQAAGTGIFMLFGTAVLGTIAHAVRGHVHLGLAATLLIGATLSAQLGALATKRVRPRTLRRAFSIIVALTMVSVIVDLARRS